MQKKSSSFYLNIILSIVVILFAVNTFSPQGHNLIKTALAQAGAISGQGTVNYLARYANAGNPSSSIGNSMIYDDGAGHVGVGTASPSAGLDVYSTGVPQAVFENPSGNARNDIKRPATSNVAQLLFNTNGTLDYQIGEFNDTNLQIRSISNTSNTITLTGSTGYVGVGTTNPQKALHVYSNNSNTTRLLVQNGQVGGLQASVELIDPQSDWTMYTTATDQSLGFWDANANGGTGAKRVTFDANGHVGIGTVSPNSILHIAASNSASELFVGDNWMTPLADAQTRMYIGNSAANTSIVMGQSNNDNGIFRWVYNAASGNGYLRIDTTSAGAAAGNVVLQQSGGNVGIGTANPQAPLQVNGAVMLTPLAADPSNPQNGMMWMRQ
jgi:hypothetical protein